MIIKLGSLYILGTKQLFNGVRYYLVFFVSCCCFVFFSPRPQSMPLSLKCWSWKIWSRGKKNYSNNTLCKIICTPTFRIYISLCSVCNLQTYKHDIICFFFFLVSRYELVIATISECWCYRLISINRANLHPGNFYLLQKFLIIDLTIVE